MAAFSKLRLILLLCLAGCGGAAPVKKARQSQAHEAFDVPTFLLNYAEGATRLFVLGEGEIDELKKSLKKLGGKERRAAYRQLAVLYIFDAESQEKKRQRNKAFREARRMASKSMKGAKDRLSRAEAMFVHLWGAWRTKDKDAAKRAADFIEKYPQPSELLNMAWVIRGEIALRKKRYKEAKRSYRFMFGQLNHPLYGLALLRTADAHEAEDKIEEADKALEEVLALGCDASAPDPILETAEVAAGQLEIAVREDASGKLRPVTCKEVEKGPDPDKPWLN